MTTFYNPYTREYENIQTQSDEFFTAEQLQRIRELRLWHWKQYKDYLIYESSDRECRRWPTANRNRDAGEKHLRFVQTLNDFFPVDDTAEKDATK